MNTACIHTHKCRDGQGRLCQNDATVFYMAPDGTQVPGAGACDMHARRTMDEYRVKLGEKWSTRTVCECGFDGDVRWGNCALEGYGVNSPAMMEARAIFDRNSTCAQCGNARATRGVHCSTDCYHGASEACHPFGGWGR